MKKRGHGERSIPKMRENTGSRCRKCRKTTKELWITEDRVGALIGLCRTCYKA